MLPVKSGMIGRTITETRVISVAKGALENVLQGKEDHSRYMNPLDYICDLFCDGVKRSAIEHIHGMSLHTALLHTELEKPLMERSSDIISTEIDEIDQNKQQLSKLALGRTLEFGYQDSRPVVDDRSFLVLRDQSETMPLGVALYPKSGSDDEPVSHIIPTFETREHINVTDLVQIRIAEKIKCNGKEYKVRFTGLDEPILLCHCPDLFAKTVQSKLSALWIVEQARLSLSQLQSVIQLDGNLQFPSILPDVEAGQIRTMEESAEIDDWGMATDMAVMHLRTMAQRLRKKLTADKDGLAPQFELLANGTVPFDSQRGNLLKARSMMQALALKQDGLDNDICELRIIYQKLHSLAKACENSEMRSILLTRFEEFNGFFRKYNRRSAEMDQVQKFLAVKNSTIEFLENFSSSKLMYCLNLLDPSPTIIRPSSILQPPKTLPERAILVGLLGDPEAPWKKINGAMDTLKNVQEDWLAGQIERVKLIAEIDQRFQAVKGDNGNGLDPGTGRSFYTQETFSRIVSLRAIKALLIDSRNKKTIGQLNQLEIAIASYFFIIDQETQKIGESRKHFGIEMPWKAQLHSPRRINGEFMNHEQWINHQKQQELDFLLTST